MIEQLTKCQRDSNNQECFFKYEQTMIVKDDPGSVRPSHSVFVKLV